MTNKLRTSDKATNTQQKGRTSPFVVRNLGSEKDTQVREKVRTRQSEYSQR